jgi:predicted component of type VI protein secretion system
MTPTDHPDGTWCRYLVSWSHFKSIQMDVFNASSSSETLLQDPRQLTARLYAPTRPPAKIAVSLADQVIANLSDQIIRQKKEKAQLNAIMRQQRHNKIDGSWRRPLTPNIVYGLGRMLLRIVDGWHDCII